MTLLAPISLSLVAMVAAILAGLLVVAYILKMRRRRFEVPFSTLWHRVLREKEATAWWKHLRRILSLLFVAFILALTVFAVTEPRLGAADKDARNVVIIIDASASMKTLDGEGGKTRLDVAKTKAMELLDAMGAGDAAMIMRMDGRTTPLSRFATDKAALKRSLDKLVATDTPADLRRALSAAADALHERQNGLIVILGDGAYPKSVIESIRLNGVEPAEPAESATKLTDEAAAADKRGFAKKRLDLIDLSGIDLRFIGVGEKSENVGIVAFNVRRYISNKMSYEVFIEVQNFGEEPARRKLVLKNGELPIDVKEMTLQPGERKRAIYPDRGGGDDSILTAELQLPDAEGDEAKGDIFPIDDVAYALLPERKRQQVLLVTTDNLYLEGAMLVYDSITVDKVLPTEYEKMLDENRLPPYHAIVFDDYTPAKLPPARTHLAYFNPQGEHSPFKIRGTLKRPKIERVNDDHPVMRWITMSDVNFDQVSKFEVRRERREVALLTSISPIAAAKREGRRKVVAFGFSLDGTDLMLRVAFPLMLVNMLDWFAGDDADLITTYTTGKRVRVPLDGTTGINEVEVKLPPNERGQRGKSKAPVTGSHASFYAANVGVHDMTASEDGDVVAKISLAANLSNPEESNIAPSPELIVGSADAPTTLEEPSGFKITRRQSIWLYLALLVLVLLGVEWFTYNRRITV